jgi:hypothetical protein
LRRLLRWSRRLATDPAEPSSPHSIQRIAWLVKGASAVVFLRCLPRSLALRRILARRGIASDVRIGVQTADGVLLAHAWVECQGRALNDDERTVATFAAFDHLEDDVSHA